LDVAAAAAETVIDVGMLTSLQLHDRTGHERRSSWALSVIISICVHEHAACRHHPNSDI